jgi:hypothetical protein
MTSDHHHGHIEYRFCPRCGGDLEKRVVKATEPKRLVCLNCSFVFYQDPKVVAGTVFTLDGESQMDVELGALLNVYSYPRSPNVIVVYAAQVVGGELAAGDESVEAGVFAATKIPWNDLAFDSTKDALNDFIKLYLK